MALAIPTDQPEPPWNPRMQWLDRSLNQYLRYEYMGEWVAWSDFCELRRFRGVEYWELFHVLRHASRKGRDDDGALLRQARYEFQETRQHGVLEKCVFRLRLREPLPKGAPHHGNRGSKHGESRRRRRSRSSYRRR